MNETILALAAEARLGQIYNGTQHPHKTGKFLPKLSGPTNEQLLKFAELIVQEAIDVVQRRYMGDNNREDVEVLRCVDDLKKYFGVE